MYLKVVFYICPIVCWAERRCFLKNCYRSLLFRSTWVVKLNPQLGRKKEIDEIDNFFFSSQLGIYSISHTNWLSVTNKS